jgi:D-alanyl-D-alanine carboxypeptidase/D-alanyl-D-alanine-endopeptidase (penicillin-binding protein 4)
MYRIHFRTGSPGSKPEVMAFEPEVPGLIINNLLTAEGVSDKGYVYIEPYGDFAEIRGTIPANRDDFILKASLPDPPQFAASLLNELLTESGVKIKLSPTSLRKNSIITGANQSSDAVVLFVGYSPILSEIVSATNHESLNMFAENLLRMISVSDMPDSPGSIQHGIEVVKSFVEKRGIETKGLYMTDGSGLSRYNAVSSLFMVKLLTYMRTNSEHSDLFYNSLPRAGEEGTLKDYFKDPVFHGRLSAKSGTATRIRNYAGYLTTLSGDQYSFAVLVNNFDCTASEVTAKVEILLKDIIESK